jgi:hypothetical protein
MLFTPLLTINGLNTVKNMATDRASQFYVHSCSAIKVLSISSSSLVTHSWIRYDDVEMTVAGL